MPQKSREFALLTRRTLLATASGITVAAVMPAWAAAPKSGLADFMTLSHALTERGDLDPQLGGRLYEALSELAPDMAGQIQTFSSFAKSEKSLDADGLAAAVAAQQKPLAATLQTLLTAWYVGVVGNVVAGTGRVVAFQSALMFEPVRDVVVVPSYCRAEPGYWVDKPARS